MTVSQKEVGNQLAFSQSPDLSRIQQLTDQLDESSIQLEAFFNLSNDLLAISDRTHFRRLNRKWEEVLGWSLEELYAYPHQFFTHPDDKERTRKAIESLQVGPLQRFVNRLRSKDGQYRVLEWTASKLQDGFTYAVARDITELCKACPERHEGCSILVKEENAPNG